MRSHRDRSRVLFVPDWRHGNPYMERLAHSLNEEGFHIAFRHPPRGYFRLAKLARAHADVGTIHIHWTPPLLDNLYWSTGKIKKFLKLIIFAADLIYCRAANVKIVWTIHNLLEHETVDAETEVKARVILMRLANNVIVHSEEARRLAADYYGIVARDKTSVIPHGHYIGCYRCDESVAKELMKRCSITEDHTVFLFFGAIRPYKGLETLMAAFKSTTDPNFRLIVAGRPFTDEVAQGVVAEAKGDSRILLALEFVPEDQVAAYFSLADAVVLPFEKILTSGSVILAMGFGKCLILPEGARVLGVPGDEGAFYFDDIGSLRNIMDGISKTDTARKGTHNLRIAESLDWKTIARTTARLYTTRTLQTES